MKKIGTFIALCTLLLSLVALLVAQSYLASPAQASGIFTLKGKLKGFTESQYEIQTSTVIYELRASALSKAQIADLKKKKTGQMVDLVVSTDAVARVRDVPKNK